MADIFLKFVNMSISASWLVLAVIILRILLKKAPKWLTPVLWGVVGLRLMMPFSIESALSLIPSAETIDITKYSARPYISSGINAFDKPVNEYLGSHYFEGVTVPANNLFNIASILGVIWLLGMIVMTVYTVASYIQLRKKVDTAVLLQDNIYRSEHAASPFVLGLVRPRIYLPFQMEEKDMTHVIAHEQTHIKRHDHWVKPFGFLLLSLYWFNPVIWVAYILLCRDIELACDERVIQELGTEQRADYSQALLSCSVPRRMISACPLAFGEIGVKERVKNVLNYKKPAFWIVMVAVVASIVVAVCFLTNPVSDKQDLSFLNYKNLSNLAHQAEILNVRHPLENIRDTVSGTDVAEFLNDGNWKEKNMESPLKLAADTIIIFNNKLEIRFYESEPQLAMIVSSGQWRYYTMQNQEYSDVVQLLEKSDNVNSVEVEISSALEEEVPSAVIDYAKDYVFQRIVSYHEGWPKIGDPSNPCKITNAKITGLTQINTGTASLTSGLNLYLLEYRLRVEGNVDSVIVGGMNAEMIDGESWLTEWSSAGQPYLLLHWDDSSGEALWLPICAVDTEGMIEFNSPKMLGKYGDKYTAAAMELYAQYLKQNQ